MIKYSEGSWKDDKQHGEAKVVKTDGSFYTGEWIEGDFLKS